MSDIVLAVVGDIFFASKIRGTAEHLGINLKLARDFQTAKRLLESDTPRLILVDLHCEGCKPFQLGSDLRADARYKELPLVGFFSHVQTEMKQKAKEAGYTLIIPRSLFTKRLPEILAGELANFNLPLLPQD